MTVNWSRTIGNIGRTLIMGGVLILLFVVYQLWGTAIREQRAQAELRTEFESALEVSSPELARQFDLEQVVLPERIETEAVIAATNTADAEPATSPAATEIIDTSSLAIDPTTVDYGPPPPPPDHGQPIARIRIPAIDIDKVVVEGVGTNALKNGPGHYPDTPLPGQPGNAAIAGHRTTYGAPFGELDKLESNDLIYVTTAQGTFQYHVIGSEIVTPHDLWVLDPSDDDRLTLTTCHPKFSARQRLIVTAALIGPAALASDAAQDGGIPLPQLPAAADGDDVEPTVNVTTTTAPIALPAETAATSPTTAGPPQIAPPTSAANLNLGSGETPTDTQPGTTVAAEQSPTTFEQGLDGDQAATWPAIAWALLSVFVWVGFWYLSHHWRQWPAYLLGTPVFLVVLFMFFENVSRLLPSAA